MQGLLGKWNQYQTSRRLNSLWNEYKQQARFNDDKALQKLDEFLSQLKEQMLRYIQQSPNMSVIMSECDDVLKCILQYFGRYEETIKQSQNIQLLSDILDKALDVVEFIIRDPKYKKQIEQSPQFISDLLNLIVKVESSESKVTIIKILMLLADNVQSKVEFGRQNGFKKLLELIINNNNELGRIVSKALLHFLNIPQLQNKLLSSFGIPHELPDEQLNSIKSKLKKLADDFRTITASELQRIFAVEPRGGKQSTHTEAELTTSQSVSQQSSNELPEVEEVFEFRMLLQSTSSAILSPTSEEGKASPKKTSDKLTKDEEDIIKEFAVVQGGLKSICESLIEAAEEIQLDFLSTITKLLLSDNPKYKEEFKNIDGYRIFEKFFNDSRDFSDKSTIFFLQSCFEFVTLIVYEGEPMNQIKNLDCFTFLMQLIANSPHHEIIIMGLSCIQSLFNANWRNVVIAQKHGFSGYVFHLLKRIAKLDNKLFYINAPTLEITPIMCLRTHDNDSSDEEEEKEITKNDKHVHHAKKMMLTNLDFIEITSDQTQTLLMNTATLITYYSNVLGVYDADVEMILCEMTLTMSEGNPVIRQIFIDSLLDVILLKLPRMYGSYIFLEDYHDMLFTKLTLLFRSVYYNYYQTGGEAENFLKCTQVIDKIFMCSHDNHTDLLNRIMPDSRFATKTLSCRNICIESKNHLIESIRAETKSKEQMISYLGLLNTRSDKKREFMALFKIFKDVLRNIPEIRQIFFEADGLERLYTVILNTWHQLKNDNLFINDISDILLELSLGNGCSIPELRSQGFQIKPESIPTLDPKNCEFLILLFRVMLACRLTEENAAVFEILTILLHHPENLRVFKESSGFLFLLRVFVSFCSAGGHYLHTQLISCFEIFIQRMMPEEIDIFFDIIVNSEFLKKEGASEIFVDTLSLLSVHFAINNVNPIVERVIAGDYIMNLFCCFETGDHYVKEATLKFVALLLHLTKNYKKLTQFTTQRQRVISSLCKLLHQSTTATDQLLTILYELPFCSFDLKSTIIVFFPGHSTTVSAIINRSSIADVLLNHTKGAISTKERALSNIDFFEAFLVLLKKSRDDNIKNDYLRKLESHLDAPNIEKLLESNFLLWIASFAKDDLIKPEQPRHLQALFSLLFKIILQDLRRPPKQMKFVETIKKMTDDDYLVTELIKFIFTKLRENPIITEPESNLLKNLASIFQNINEIIGSSWEIDFMILKLINIYASKNAGNVRTQMKNLELFDIRDNLLVHILRFSNDNQNMLAVIKDLSFGAVANQSKFRESHTISFLLKLLLDKSATSPDVQNYVVKILKDEVGGCEDNQIYVAKLVENQRIILSLFPDYNEPMSTLAKCLSSIRKSSAEKDHDSDEDEGEDEEEKKRGEVTVPNPRMGQKPVSMNIRDLVDYINSPGFDEERKAIIVRIKRNIMNIMTEYARQEAKILNKIAERKKKVFESTLKERQSNERGWSELDHKINVTQGRLIDRFKHFMGGIPAH